jgi:hypothetical protein
MLFTGAQTNPPAFGYSSNFVVSRFQVPLAFFFQ